MAALGRSRRRQARLRAGARGAELSPLARKQLELDNAVAAELAGSEDASCARSRATSTATCTCAATCSRSTAMPRPSSRRRGRPRAVGADRPGPRDRGRDDRGGDPRARSARVAVGDPRGRRLAPPHHQGRAQDRQPEALRRLDPPQHDHVRDRPGRHRQDVPGGRAGRRGAQPPRGQPDHPHPPRGRGRRAAGLPARRPDGQGRPVPAAAVRRAARHARARARSPSTSSAE